MEPATKKQRITEPDVITSSNDSIAEPEITTTSSDDSIDELKCKELINPWFPKVLTHLIWEYLKPPILPCTDCGVECVDGNPLSCEVCEAVYCFTCWTMGDKVRLCPITAEQGCSFRGSCVDCVSSGLVCSSSDCGHWECGCRLGLEPDCPECGSSLNEC